MPRIALVVLCVLGGCSFEADYSGGTYPCSATDRKCPSGQECRLDLSTPECRKLRMDAAIDMPPDDVLPDGPPPALTCADPGILVAGATVSGTTVGRPFSMMSFCGGGVQNARDAVYKITTTAANQQLTVFITSSTLTAYVLNTCSPSAACLTGNVASNGNPLAVTAASAGPYWIVVDNLNAGLTDAYSLRVTVQ